MLNPAGNRVHGFHFVLHSDFAGPAMLKDRALAGLARKAGVSLYSSQPASCSPGRTGLTLRLGGSSSHFSIDLNCSPPPRLHAARRRGGSGPGHAFREKRGCGRSKNHFSDINALLPRVLRIIESWDDLGRI